MLTEIIASLHITMPVFLLMMLGVLFRRTGIIQDRFAKDLDACLTQTAVLRHQLCDRSGRRRHRLRRLPSGRHAAHVVRARRRYLQHGIRLFLHGL